MKDSRSATKPMKTKLEKLREEMDAILSENRFGGGIDDKASLVARIRHWRSELFE